ncbi:T9SS type A sorting domain-containing protein [Flavobacterium sp. XGLA_31]|uniref:T9SS type A sorting domain-containing protein n=1 Tax=Flavobacterium sp. XGLA_31 TaxID=3447666 RepID=UPI003F414CA3
MKKLLLSLSLFALGFYGNAQSWISQATGFDAVSTGISQIEIVDANTVWGLAFDGSGGGGNYQAFTKTTDAGANWTPGTIEMGDPLLEINNITAVSDQVAWVSALVPADGNGVIYKTIDGGQTWEQQNGIEFTTSGESFLNGVHFFDANEGLAYGDPEGGEFEIYRTIDGGTTWTRVPGASLPNPLTNEYGYNGGNVAVGNTVWLPTSRGRILKSTDRGITWTVSQSPLTDFGGLIVTTSTGRMYFTNNNTGIIVGSLNSTATTPTYKIYTTTNGGTTWSTGVTYTGYRLMAYVPGTTTLVACGAGTSSGGTGSSYSNDNGVTWTSIDTGEQRLSPAFLNGSTGWCGGFSADSVTDGIFQFSGNLANPQFASSAFKVYPNPASSMVTISAEQLDSYNVKVTDITGKVMLNKEFSGVENTVDVTNFSAGVYFFEVNSGNKSQTIKIIKN